MLRSVLRQAGHGEQIQGRYRDWVETPVVRYVITDDDVRVAYQDFGTGPPVVFSQNLFGHLEAYWEFNSLQRVFERLASNIRVLMFDHRGAGMSDGFVEPPSIDNRCSTSRLSWMQSKSRQRA